MVAEVPEIGLNLHDHPNAGAVYGIDEEISLFGALNEENLALFEAEGRGPLTSNVAEAGGFIRTRDGLEAPDIQFHFAPARFQSEGLVPGDGHGFALGGLRPQAEEPRLRGARLARPDGQAADRPQLPGAPGRRGLDGGRRADVDGDLRERTARRAARRAC